ncbi:MAG TPA: hypothetical protein PLT65_04395 [Bacilli bacterium]|nr:hypothetical protein [Bacilli bacterium]
MFTKTYYFNSSKGAFRLFVSKEAKDVRVEVEPSKFVSVKDLWLPKTIGVKKQEEIDLIKKKHLEEYESMINTLAFLTEISCQDEYILSEMRSQGYTPIRR